MNQYMTQVRQILDRFYYEHHSKEQVELELATALEEAATQTLRSPAPVATQTNDAQVPSMTDAVKQFLYTHPLQHNKKELLRIIEGVEHVYKTKIDDLQARIPQRGAAESDSPIAGNGYFD